RRRRGRMRTRPTAPRIGSRQADRFVRPRVIDIEMERAVAQDHRCAAGKSSTSAAFAARRFSSASLYPGLRRSASLNWITAWEIWPLARYTLPRLLYATVDSGSVRSAAR